MQQTQRKCHTASWLFSGPSARTPLRLVNFKQLILDQNNVWIILSDDCQASVSTGFPDLLSYLSCTKEVDGACTFDTATLSQLTNGTYCSSINQEVKTDDISEGHILRCDIVGYPGMDVCRTTIGSHTATFYSYLAARMVFDFFHERVYTLLDGTSMR